MAEVTSGWAQVHFILEIMDAQSKWNATFLATKNSSLPFVGFENLLAIDQINFQFPPSKNMKYKV